MNQDHGRLLFQYYLSEATLGKNRAVVAKEQLKDLNSYVNVSHSSDKIDIKFLNDHKINVRTKKKLLKSN